MTIPWGLEVSREKWNFAISPLTKSSRRRRPPYKNRREMGRGFRMEGEAMAGELSSFQECGIYCLPEGSGAVFVDPVLVLSKSYARHRLRRSSYYARSFHSPQGGARGDPAGEEQVGDSSSASRKRKRKKKGKPRDMNERERAAELRHQEARPFLLKAHECFLRAAELLSVLPTVTRDDASSQVEIEAPPCNFIELGSVWQASHWEIALCLPSQGTQSGSNLCAARTVMPLFDNPIANETDDDLEAEFLNNRYILPSKSCLHMSDLRQIHDLIPAHSDYGFNLIVIDPPWENASAYQKSLYPTLPSRHFLYIPVRQLAHTQGALVALWVTNREKLRVFVEKELFPAWGVTDVSIYYWLKVKDDGSLIGDLDLFHHRPYECLVLGYINSKEIGSGCDVSCAFPQSNQVIISIPSAYSRKPPLGKLLSKYVPGPKPGKFVELFARELHSGWTCWGNEPLCFQDARYFVKRIPEEAHG